MALKLLLLQPPIEDFYETDVRLQPIGLAYLEAAVRRRLPEVEVKIRDLHRGFGRHTIPVPAELSYLAPYYPYPDRSPFSTFHAFYHFGATWRQVADVVREEKPDVVGISALFTPYYREALRVARIVKENSQAVVVLGGSHVSADPGSVLASRDVDFVVVGEGEKPLADLVSHLLTESSAWQDVPGLGYRTEDGVRVNPPAEDEPLDGLMPDLRDLPLETYRFKGRPMTFVVTSRSCPHRCSFCSVHTTFGFRYRRRSPGDVLRELEARYAAGYRVFDFEDDNLTYYVDEMKDLCRAIADAFPAKDAELVAMNGISYLSLDRELLVLMKAAGFTHLNLALVSSDASVLESTKRPHTVRKYLEVVEDAHRLGFVITSYQILGLPFETLESMVQTLVFQATLPVLLGASPFYLTPASPVAKKLGVVMTPSDYFKARLTALDTFGGDFTRDDVYTLLVTTRIVNFLKSRGGGPRAEIGREILGGLLDTGVLHAFTGDRYLPLPRFNAALFFKVWEQVGAHFSAQRPHARL